MFGWLKKLFTKTEENQIERFKADVEKTDSGGRWRPKIKIFVNYETHCCCVLSAACMAHHKDVFDIVDKIRKTYGFSDSFIMGIVNGFDGSALRHDDYKQNQQFLDGYTLGQELNKKYIKGD